jgi:hypothetical protein
MFVGFRADCCFPFLLKKNSDGIRRKELGIHGGERKRECDS